MERLCLGGVAGVATIVPVNSYGFANCVELARGAMLIAAST